MSKSDSFASASPLHEDSVPNAALALGALGAVPFVVLSGASLVLEGLAAQQALFALATYGAVILSFLGGIHWGLAVAPAPTGSPASAKLRRLGASVVPSLVGWVALSLPTGPGLLVLSAAFALMLSFDLYAQRRGEAPPWYPKLRLPLTLVVCVALLLAAIPTVVFGV